MKKQLLIITVLFVTGFINLQAQECVISKDSVIAGNNETTFTNYIYNTNDLLIKKEYADSGSSFVYEIDSFIYNANDQLLKMERRSIDSLSPFYTLTYTYDGSGRISAVTEAVNAPWYSFSATFDVISSGPDYSSVLPDTSSITGTPEELMGFRNMSYTNGNMTSVDLVVFDSTGVEVDTFEISASHDTKKNVHSLKGPDDILGYFAFAFNA